MKTTKSLKTDLPGASLCKLAQVTKHILKMHAMPVSPSYVLLRIFSSFERYNPCSFRMCVVTCASLQSEAPGKSVFRDLDVFTKSGII